MEEMAAGANVFLLAVATATMKILYLDNNLAVYSVGKQSPGFFRGKDSSVHESKEE